MLVGHSLGGLLVCLYAARYLEEVAGLVLVDSAHEQQYLRAPREIQELVPQVEEQGRQQFEGLKALIASGSLDPAVLPIPSQLPAVAAEIFWALVAASPKHVETFRAEQQAVGPSRPSWPPLGSPAWAMFSWSCSAMASPWRCRVWPMR